MIRIAIPEGQGHESYGLAARHHATTIMAATDEAFWKRMRAAFSGGEIVDLARCVAAWTGLGRVAHVLGSGSVCLPFAPEAA